MLNSKFILSVCILFIVYAVLVEAQIDDQAELLGEHSSLKEKLNSIYEQYGILLNLQTVNTIGDSSILDFSRNSFYQKNLNEKGKPSLNLLVIYIKDKNEIGIVHSNTCSLDTTQLAKLVKNIKSNLNKDYIKDSLNDLMDFLIILVEKHVKKHSNSCPIEEQFKYETKEAEKLRILERYPPFNTLIKEKDIKITFSLDPLFSIGAVEGVIGGSTVCFGDKLCLITFHPDVLKLGENTIIAVGIHEGYHAIFNTQNKEKYKFNSRTRVGLGVEELSRFNEVYATFFTSKTLFEIDKDRFKSQIKQQINYGKIYYKLYYLERYGDPRRYKGAKEIIEVSDGIIDLSNVKDYWGFPVKKDEFDVLIDKYFKDYSFYEQNE